jgi:hypothetical protein
MTDGAHTGVHWIGHHAEVQPDKPAIIMTGSWRVTTFAELDHQSGLFAAGLVERGLKPGDAVAVQLPNLPHFLIAYFGIMKAGLRMVPINPLLKAPEIAYHLGDSDSKLLITFEMMLPDALPGADVFLGLSAPNVLKPEWLATMAEKPLILALANPDPEITPDAARAARPDAIIATGRSDFPNQVNNVLCFPFIFRGALDVGATEINEEMKVACVEAIATLARVEASEVVAAAYGGAAPVFGPEYIIPKPFDPRLILQVAPAVARAAMESGVALRPIADFDA